MRDLQITLVYSNSKQQNNENELTLIFDKLSVFQEGVLQNIYTVIERVDNTEASTLTCFADQGSIKLEALVEHISELEKDRISDCLRIDVFGIKVE